MRCFAKIPLKYKRIQMNSFKFFSLNTLKYTDHEQRLWLCGCLLSKLLSRIQGFLWFWDSEALHKKMSLCQHTSRYKSHKPAHTNSFYKSLPVLGSRLSLAEPLLCRGCWDTGFAGWLGADFAAVWLEAAVLVVLWLLTDGLFRPAERMHRSSKPIAELLQRSTFHSLADTDAETFQCQLR